MKNIVVFLIAISTSSICFAIPKVKTYNSMTEVNSGALISRSSINRNDILRYSYRIRGSAVSKYYDIIVRSESINNDTVIRDDKKKDVILINKLSTIFGVRNVKYRNSIFIMDGSANQYTVIEIDDLGNGKSYNCGLTYKKKIKLLNIKSRNHRYIDRYIINHQGLLIDALIKESKVINPDSCISFFYDME